MNSPHSIWRAALTLWIVVWVGILVSKLFTAPIAMLSMMDAATFPLGYLVHGLADTVFDAFYWANGLMPPARAATMHYGIPLVMWMVMAAVGYWQWFVALPWCRRKLNLGRFFPGTNLADDRCYPALAARLSAGFCLGLLGISAFMTWGPIPYALLNQLPRGVFNGAILFTATLGMISGIAGIVFAVRHARPWLFIACVPGSLANAVIAVFMAMFAYWAVHG